MIDVTKDALRRVFPGARPEYLEAFVSQKAELDKAGVTASPLRWSHFLGQIGAETGGLKTIREDMSYRAETILKVFGAGRHSARVSRAEARRLAHNPEALAERVYGLGNPKKARVLGNTEEGDAYAYRGWGPGQVTGKGKTLEYGERMEVDFETSPELLDHPAIGLKAMLMEWGEKDCNKFADLNQIGCVSRAINLGNPYHKSRPNGMENRQAAFSKAWSVYRETGSAEPHVLRKGDHGADVKDLQGLLATLGYFPGYADAKFGPRTEHAVLAFQSDHALTPDGKVGKRTWAALREARPIEQGDRALLTANTLLSRGSTQVATARKVQRSGWLGISGGTAGLAAATVLPETIEQLPAAIQSFQSMAESFSAAVAWFCTPQGLLGAGLVVVVWYAFGLIKHGRAVEGQRVEEARSGANLSK